MLPAMADHPDSAPVSVSVKAPVNVNGACATPDPGADTLGQTRAVEVVSVAGARAGVQMDRVAVESPVEIRVRPAGSGPDGERSVSITMRTPGAGGDPREDAELAAGFLFTEGLIRDRAHIAAIHHPRPSVVVVELAAGVTIELRSMERNFYATSACGVCGKGSLEAIRTIPAVAIREGGPPVPAALVCTLPDRLRAAQSAFDETGGIHAAGLFAADGTLLAAREDVGRHNAVDKLIGARLLAGALPAHGQLLVVSGRASFELVQKARMAAVPIFAAVGAPSSLAVELATECGMTLLGFVREGRCNLYAAPGRIALAANPVPEEGKGWQPEATAATPRRRLRTIVET